MLRRRRGFGPHAPTTLGLAATALLVRPGDARPLN